MYLLKNKKKFLAFKQIKMEIVLVGGEHDDCLSHMEDTGLYELFGLPEVIPVQNPDYHGQNPDYHGNMQEDSDTDEEDESRALAMGPHGSTIEFILDHIMKHGIRGMDPGTFQANLEPFANEENLQDLYIKAFKKVYGSKPQVKTIDYDMGEHPEYKTRGQPIKKQSFVPIATPIEDGDEVAKVTAELAELGVDVNELGKVQVAKPVKFGRRRKTIGRKRR